ncbi:MAG: prephenate dehydratase [Deltaproteobacteria bacterium]|nr:prephenate dehydratase [Deltaproteobacteria bacterium]
MEKKELIGLRKRIDEIDASLLELLNQRQSLSIKVGHYKNSEGLKIFDPGRERDLLDRLKTLNSGPLSDQALANIYRQVISASVAAQASIKVGYLGPEATFAHEAALNQFGNSAHLIPQGSHREVFQGVDRDRFSYGVVAVENSSQGGVGETLDLFLEFDLQVCQEIRLRINHHLMSRAEDLNEVKRVYSHPQALQQCSLWLASNLPDVPLLEAGSTSAAARQAAEEKDSAAVASSVAADIYGLEILGRAIQSAEQNVTRFLILAKSSGARTGRDKTSIIATTKNTPGALFSLMQPFAANGINMTKIESRPMKGEAWAYVFFIDLEGHVKDEVMKRTLDEVQQHSRWLKVLGSYPQVD